MTPERWQEVKKLLAGALERPPKERRVYLDEACTDAELRREAETLLTAHEETESFLDMPAVNTGLLQKGTKLGPYTIVERIGAGGMGVVYMARDTKLGRLLALKVLAEGSLAGATARARLLREARNASALNHPNIATIYEAGEDAGQVYIAMELVEGRPLSAVIQREGLAPETVIRYGLEMAAALSHAHERGMVHRDLKPANVVVTTDGHVKVLDFGLAKRLSASEIAQATVSEKSLTEFGAIVGTLPYMAPETLRGEEPDARTDVWALGAVLYEMAAGSPPFRGGTPYELSSAILREAPAALPSRVPASLQSVMQRCLAKEREQRYQRASEARAALETIGPYFTVVEPVRAAPPRHRGAIGAGVAALVLLLLAAAGFEWLRQTPGGSPAASPANWVQLTDFADSAISPALSPDGRILAFIRGGDTFIGPGQIYAKVLPDGEPVQLTNDSRPKMSPEFSPDGSTVAYTTANWSTWTVPVLGGEARLMMPNAEGLTWIDANHLLFSEVLSGLHMAVETATTTGAQSRLVYVPPRQRGMAHRSALSPDGKWVLIAEMDNGGWLPCRLVPFDGSSSGQRVGPQDAACTYVAWSPDQKWMYMSSDKGERFHIWRQRFPDGKPQQVTTGATEEEGIAVAPDGASLITSVGLRESTIWVHDERGERQVSSEGFAQNPEFSPDGKKLYYLVQPHGVSGEFVSGELWAVNLATGRSERLLPGTLVTGYAVSPDGTKVAYSVKDDNGESRLWLASLDLRFPPREFAANVNEDQPAWDRAGQIYFRAAEGGFNSLYRMNEDGSGRSKAMPNPILEFHAVSPDGRWATVYETVGSNPEPHEVAVPLDGGTLQIVCTTYCVSSWSDNGKEFGVIVWGMGRGLRTALLSVNLATGLPSMPPGGIVTPRGTEEVNLEMTKGARVVDGPVIPGETPDVWAIQREDVHRNLFRVPLK
jgi:eukaryotic-like serine/threonine-protein kinase